MKLVCKESPREYLQPFKDKLEEFFKKGRRLLSCTSRILFLVYLSLPLPPSFLPSLPPLSLSDPHCHLLPE
jgi:hypothetical protein